MGYGCYVSIQGVFSQKPSSPFHQKGYKMKSMDFSVELGERRRNSHSYCNDEQRRVAGKDAI